MKIIVYIFFLLPWCVSAQNSISGSVIDQETNLPIESATVYVNGSTKGTTTNSLGLFMLEGITFPCQLIVSHVSYSVISLYISAPMQSLNIQMIPRLVAISEVKVADKNARELNLRLFNKLFIGNDYWGRNARILNDSVLYFTSRYQVDTLWSEDSIRTNVNFFGSEDFEWAEDSSYHIHRQKLEFEVKAKEPLQVRLPMFGYDLRIDLSEFKVSYQLQEKYSVSNYLGFFHYIPFENSSRRNRRVFGRNKRIAYYNSRQHFCKSLITNRLPENGYELLLLEEGHDSIKRSISKVNIDTCLIKVDSQTTQIVGLNNKTFIINYYENVMEKPMNLTKWDGYEAYRSKLVFLSDTVVILSSGITPNNQLMFGDFMSKKKVGASLPEEYYLSVGRQ